MNNKLFELERSLFKYKLISDIRYLNEIIYEKIMALA